MSQTKFLVTLIGVRPVEVEVGNPLLFWKNRSNDFPVLSHVARKYLTASASSVSVNVFRNWTHYEQPTFKAPTV